MHKTQWYYFPTSLLLCALTGVLIAFSLPPRGYSFLAWVAFIPLLISARIERPIVSCLGGLIAGLLCGWICGGHWEEAYQYGNLVAAFGTMGIVLAFVAFFGSLSYRKISPGLWPFYIACLGVAAEFLSLHLFPIYFAISQFKNPAALHLASVTGIWGVSFLLWLCCAGLVTAYDKLKIVPALWVTAAVLLLSLLIPIKKGPVIRVAAVQAEDSYVALHQTMELKGKAEFIVCPELLLYPCDPNIAKSAEKSGAYLAVDVSEHNKKDPNKPYNTVYIVSPEGKKVASFRKTHLFGKERFSITSGGRCSPVRVGNIKVAAPICFDAEYTDICRNYVRNGAQVLLIPNHDPYIPNYAFHYLHFAVIPFRAAENGVPIAWSECKNLSSIIDCDGRIIDQALVKQTIAEANTSKEKAAIGPVHMRNGRTFYSIAGDYFAYLCLIGLVAFMLPVARFRSGNS